MKHVRWYDKNSELKEVFEFIQGLDKNSQDAIAQDIIQILMNDFSLDLDREINQISENYNYQCKRWYDHNIDLFTSFEIIKNLPDGMKKQVINKIIETALLMYLEEDIK
jgi:hypothetical protein